MKSCPTCNRTFDDTMSFCLVDGAILSAPFDPAATREPAPRSGSAPPTEVMPRAVVEDQVIPATIQSPPLSTIQSPAPSVPLVSLPDETESKITAEELGRLVRVWEDKVGARRTTGSKARLVLLRALAFGLGIISAFFALRALMITYGNWQFGLVQAAFALLLGWGALRCWRLSTIS